MSFTLKLENSRILKGIVETLASIIDETEFMVTPKEFTISAMDPSRICLLKLSIKKDNFDDYKCSKESKVGLNLDDLDKILKRCAANDSVEIDFNEKDQKIKIKMQREGTSRTRTFSLALLDIDIEEIPMENLLNIEYSSKWVIDPEFLVEAIKDAEIYSEILNMKSIEDQGLVFSSTGQIGEMNYELELDELIETDISGTSSGAYSLTFLKAILKISSITEKLEISLKTDHPLKMMFNLLEGGELFYFLAPRVEEADFDEDEDMDEF
ncbi:MAG: proliferating cell nuclear antigen (pcna) [Promethearchaeota archaeon]|nr:MAG: proliferating cell nuclear antigen (pcna) [Candidatus Lokiarchaeota archaeon]TFG20446.1 MAG: proliferating cell nuclear antigen (pcna) [Candidatus Lokiarchaeota archaeon]